MSILLLKKKKTLNIWTKNRKVQFLAFGTFCSLLDEFISEYERDRKKISPYI